MSKGVHISPGVLAALCGGLVVTLVALGFLLGRQSSPPAPTPEASTTPPLSLAVSQPTSTPSLSERLDALDQRVQNVGQKTIGRQSSTEQSSNATPQQQSPASGDTKAVEDYLRQIDAVVGGSAAIADPQPFAARLLQQGMSGDGQQLDSVLARTRQAKAELQGVEPPARCQEHYRLLVSQLQQSQELLSEVKASNSTGDTGRLANLAAAGETTRGDSLRLQELDRSLRQSLP